MGVPLLLRSDGRHDEKWQDGQWKPTRLVVEWEMGENDFTDQVTEAEARALFPSAFAS